MTIQPEVATGIIRVANMMADAARAAILPYFRTDALGTISKDAEGYDPVTMADRAAEQAMRGVLARERGCDAILGEEFGAQAGDTGLTWVLDPIDGTRAFVAGAPTWGVLIAVSDETGPIFGIIDQPYIGERFAGGLGRAEGQGPSGSFPLRTRNARPLAEATVFTTFPEVGTAADGKGFHAVAQNARLVRYGLDCYAYALLAAGHIDLVIEAGLAPYDIQAPIAVVYAAGGIATDWTGAPAHQGGRVVAAANTEIHAQALEILRAF